MGLFGLFGKKDAPPAPGDKDAPRSRTPAAPAPPDTEQQRQRSHRASDTAKKIDAIESEMSSEFVPSHLLTTNSQTAPPEASQNTLPDLANSTDMLLGAEVRGLGLEVNASEAAPILEEAAILFANEQDEVAEQMLRMAVAEPEAGVDAWLMLFDLYQATGRQTEFEHLSIDYARRFETSPPAWRKTLPPASTRLALPSVAFAGKLDASIVKLVEKVLKIAEQHQALRLEFGRVTEVAPVGCGLLLRTLKKLQQHDVSVIGANELTARIRAILEVGRRDETEAPWLLLLEILRLQNREHEFEETSIDYCITFEVSPPPFVPPVHGSSAAREDAAEQPGGSAFMMPAAVDGRTEPLLAAIAQHADLHDPLVLDCARLDRVDFSAAGQLMMGLAPLARNGRTIEMHHVSRLVLALFSMIGLTDIVRVSPRKH
ncbi:STAS domain-containing protein|uniref:STAS domain-containing protein n=1 Tax=Noviherbaspirillum sp. L7-7A TaxID=2850560 RepID=UPI001C2C39E1|nr:STAS domain-containing protein [Noviherbaspirillum sp. L7-7A]